MSIRFSQGKLQGAERKNVLQEVQKQAKAAALMAIQPVLTTFLEEEVTAKLGRQKGEPRWVSAQAREIDWHCGQCGGPDANQFTRDGHYRRGLETGWGHLDDLQVPMLECQNCQHDVVAHFTILEKFARSQRAVECHPGQQCGLAHARIVVSIKSNRSCTRPTVNRSAMCRPWCSSMASLFRFNRRTRRSNPINASAVGINAAASIWSS
jgi:hypothetical protein